MAQPNVPVSKTGQFPPAKLVRGGRAMVRPFVRPKDLGRIHQADRVTWLCKLSAHFASPDPIKWSLGLAQMINTGLFAYIYRAWLGICTGCEGKRGRAVYSPIPIY
jgi:hypothetical protein